MTEKGGSKDFSQYLHPEIAELFDGYFTQQLVEIDRLRGVVENLQETNDFLFQMIDNVYEELKKNENRITDHICNSATPKRKWPWQTQ
jgi:hypothetical protein